MTSGTGSQLRDKLRARTAARAAAPESAESAGSATPAAPAGPSGSRAFTLLEMIITLAVISIFVGFFVLRFDDGRADEALTRVSSELRLSALRSKRQSYAFRQDRHIVLLPGGFVTTDRPLPEEYLPGVGELPPGADFIPLPRGVRMEWQAPGASGWERREPYLWSFRASGLSDPLAVRFTIERSYTLLRFNVLTGLAEEETYIDS